MTKWFENVVGFETSLSELILVRIVTITRVDWSKYFRVIVMTVAIELLRYLAKNIPKALHFSIFKPRRSFGETVIKNNAKRDSRFGKNQHVSHGLRS